ncbi:MAG: hypothetical protein ACLUB5_00940 [Bifidobacterium dentium]
MDVTFLQWEYEFSTYPPPPEPGWYDDDVTVMAQLIAEPVANAADSLKHANGSPHSESDDHDMQAFPLRRATLPFRTRTISTGTAPCFPTFTMKQRSTLLDNGRPDR